MSVLLGLMSFQMFIKQKSDWSCITGYYRKYRVIQSVCDFFVFLIVKFNSLNEYFCMLKGISINKNFTENFIQMVISKLRKINY